MKLIADEFRSLAMKTSVPVSAIDRLYQYLDPAVEPAIDGSSELPINWSAVWVALGVFALFVILLSLVVR